MVRNVEISLLIHKMRRDFEVRSRLREIAKKSEDLTAATLKLDHMAIQLNHLRAMTGLSHALGRRRQRLEATEKP